MDSLRADQQQHQLEESCTTTSLFLHFSKAVDCHSLAQLQKLKAVGVGGEKEAERFKSYLKGRKQLVEINYTENNTNYKIRSAITYVKRCVLQGSLLGPVLFVLLTIDMPKWLDGDCSAVMYADDTVLTTSDKQLKYLR